MAENLETESENPKSPHEISTKPGGPGFESTIEVGVSSVSKMLQKFSNAEGQLLYPELILNERDREILSVNKNLDLRWQAAIVGGGVDQVDKGQFVGRVFASAFIGQGAMGTVFDAAYVEPNSSILKFGVAKVPTEKGLHIFEDEKNNARLIKDILTLYPHESGAGNLVKPLLTADNAVVYEKIADKNGMSVDLESASEEMPVSEWLSQFATAIKGLVYLHRRGLYHFDFKPSNIVVGQNGQGILVDYGAIRKQETWSEDKISTTLAYYSLEIITLQTGTTDPIADVSAVGVSLKRYWKMKFDLTDSSLPLPAKKLYDLYKSLTVLRSSLEDPLFLENVADQILTIAEEMAAIEKTIPEKSSSNPSVASTEE